MLPHGNQPGYHKPGTILDVVQKEDMTEETLHIHPVLHTDISAWQISSVCVDSKPVCVGIKVTQATRVVSPKVSE